MGILLLFPSEIELAVFLSGQPVSGGPLECWASFGMLSFVLNVELGWIFSNSVETHPTSSNSWLGCFSGPALSHSRHRLLILFDLVLPRHVETGSVDWDTGGYGFAPVKQLAEVWRVRVRVRVRRGIYEKFSLHETHQDSRRAEVGLLLYWGMTSGHSESWRDYGLMSC